MVAPHLPGKRRGVALRVREDEGWEAMAMRDELTDVMLHSAFGEAISVQVRKGLSILPGFVLMLVLVLV